MNELVTIQVERGGEIAFEAFPDGVVIFRATMPGETHKDTGLELTRRDLRGLIKRLRRVEASLGKCEG